MADHEPEPTGRTLLAAGASLCPVSAARRAPPTGARPLDDILVRGASICSVAAFVHEDGQNSFDLAAHFRRKGPLAAQQKGEISRPAPPARAFHVTEQARPWVDSKTTPQPLALAFS